MDLYLIESNPRNHQRLADEISQLTSIAGLKGFLLPRAEFSIASRSVLSTLEASRRPSFWFIDPFGFAGVPLAVVRQIMALPQSETFINFMARDANRFLEESHHAAALQEMFGHSDEQFAELVGSVVNSETRMPSLRQAYEERLRAAGNTRFTWSYRVAEAGAADTVYYLIHASNHIKALREMKDATHEESAPGQSAFLGRDDFGARAQLPLFDDDPVALQAALLEAFANRTISFEDLCNEAYPDPRFLRHVEQDFRAALNTLAAAGKIRKIPVTSRSERGLRGADRLQFPPGR